MRAAIFSSLGTAHNTATAKYLQTKQVPQLFIGSGASKFGDYNQYPNLVAGVQNGVAVDREGYGCSAQ